MSADQIIDLWDQSLAIRFTQNKIYFMFNHYRDIRARGKLQKIWPRWGCSRWVYERWRSGAHVSENVEGNSYLKSKQLQYILA